MNKKTAAYLILFAFLWSAALPFFAVYTINHGASPKSLTSLFGDKILICSGEGFKWIKAEDLQKNGGGHHTPSTYQCALCYLAAHGIKDFTTPDGTYLADNLYPAIQGVIAPRYRFSAVSLTLPFASRAPPLVAS